MPEQKFGLKEVWQCPNGHSYTVHGISPKKASLIMNLGGSEVRKSRIVPPGWKLVKKPS